MARFDRVIPPGGEGAITLEVDTSDEQEFIHKIARVLINDPETPEFTIGIKGNVWTPISVIPKHLRLTGFFDETFGTIVCLKGHKPEPLEVELVSVSIPDKVAVSLKKTENGNGCAWQLLVDNKVSQEATYKGDIKLSTNYPEKSELSVRISVNVMLSVETRPKVLDFGRLMEEHLQQIKTSGASVRRSVDVIFNKGTDPKIDKADLENSLFKVVNVSEEHPGRIYRIQVEPRWEKLKKGVNTDRLKIRTNQKGAKPLEVPIVFEIL